MDFLPGALPFSPGAVAAGGRRPDPELAARAVWFDAFVTNVDRTAANPNLLWWGQRLWLIDHGAALYVHHSWNAPGFDLHAHARRPFAGLRDHVLLPYAGPLADADGTLAGMVDRALLEEVVGLVPADWLAGDERTRYVEYLLARVEAPRTFLDAS